MSIAKAISRRSLLRLQPAGASVAASVARVAVIADDCIEARGIACRACGDACDAEAISFRPRAGGGTVVSVALQRCTGCADCLPACPVGAIALQSRPSREPQS